MGTFIETDKVAEKAVLVGLILPGQKPEQIEEYLDELEFLAQTSGLETLARFTQRLDKPDIRTFVGKGKLEEVQAVVDAEEADTVIFDDDLTPSQVRNLEQVLQCKILDRSLLILNIFSLRAKTAQAKAQVELAQYQYILPRLTRMWSHLSKQRGGVGMRGPGEKELETDRRIVRDKIALLKTKLDKIDKQAATQRKNREKVVRVALVGYTNVGKSTVMRRLAKADVFAENKLFATVDSTVRKVVVDNVPFLLTDTVGFIRKLPTTLVECFKSTLDEIREADLLLHVVDVSHPNYEEHIETVNKTLAEIGAGDKDTLVVYNKIDQLGTDFFEEDEEDEEVTPLNGHAVESLKGTYLNREQEDVVFISALNKDNFDEFRKRVLIKVLEKHMKIYPNFLPSHQIILPQDYENMQ